MTLDLANYETKANEAIRTFWEQRELAKQKHYGSGRQDRGERSSVTAGKNMDGFVTLVRDIVVANGLFHASIYRNRKLLTLPGYFRPTKLWDLLVFHQNRLVAALEFKSQVGPSFGNNFNNRCEEAIGAGHDLWTAFREGAFGEQSQPFVGWFILVEDDEKSRKPIEARSPHFPVFSEFQQVSYAERYNILCRKLIQEQLYTAAAVILSPSSAINTGKYSEISELTGLKTFVSKLAGHVAAEAIKD